MTKPTQGVNDLKVVRLIDKLNVNLHSARLQRNLSTCGSTKVGCIITDQSLRIRSSGFNGAPAGIDHCEDLGEEPKYHSELEIHAESNALGAMDWHPMVNEFIAASRRIPIPLILYLNEWDRNPAKYPPHDVVKGMLLSSGIHLIQYAVFCDFVSKSGISNLRRAIAVLREK